MLCAEYGEFMSLWCKLSGCKVVVVVVVVDDDDVAAVAVSVGGDG